MHTFVGKRGTVFNYNSDYSGDVGVTYQGKNVAVPADDLAEFVAYCAARRIIASLEQQLEASVETITLGSVGRIDIHSAIFGPRVPL